MRAEVRAGAEPLAPTAAAPVAGEAGTHWFWSGRQESCRVPGWPPQYRARWANVDVSTGAQERAWLPGPAPRGWGEESVQMTRVPAEGRGPALEKRAGQARGDDGAGPGHGWGLGRTDPGTASLDH